MTAAEAMHEADGEKCRDSENGDAYYNRNDYLKLAWITCTKLGSDHVDMKVHPSEWEYNVDIWEGLGETEIARVILGVVERSYVEMREDTREYQYRAWTGGEEAATLDGDNEDSDGEDYLGDNVDK